MMKYKKELCALGCGTALLISAGAVESMPVLSAVLIAVMAALVKIGELWEAT